MYKYKTLKGWVRAYTKEFEQQTMSHPKESGIDPESYVEAFEAGRSPQSKAIMDIRQLVSERRRVKRIANQ